MSMELHHKILVVDDEPDVVEILRYNLTKAGYEVISSSNGRDAISTALSVQPDLILLDIRMPGISGIEVCRELKREHGFGTTPIVFLTADSDDYTTLNAMSSGGDDFITKPVYPRLVVGLVNDLLKSKTGAHV